MLLLSVAGTRTLERARQQKHSAAQWQRLQRRTTNLPFVALGRIDWRGIGWARLLGGLLLYLLLLFAHRSVIGMAPPVFY